MARGRVQTAAAALVALLLVGRAGSAQSDDALVATRRALIEEAQSASEAGDHPRALDLALRASRIRESATLHRLIAQEQAAAGQPVAALASAEACIALATRDATLADRAQHIAACQALAQEQRARVGAVRVRVPSPAPAGLTVRVGAATLSEPVWGVPFLVAPGAVRIEARAANGGTFTTDVEVRAGVTLDVVVELHGGDSGEGTGGSAAAPAPPLPPTATLRVDTSPAGAAVYIDGQRRGTDGFDGVVPVGEHELEARAPGRVTQTRRVRLAAGQTERVRFELAAQGGGVLSQWWFWTAMGVVAGGIAVGVGVALMDGRAEAPASTWGIRVDALQR